MKKIRLFDTGKKEFLYTNETKKTNLSRWLYINKKW